MSTTSVAGGNFGAATSLEWWAESRDVVAMTTGLCRVMTSQPMTSLVATDGDVGVAAAVTKAKSYRRIYIQMSKIHSLIGNTVQKFEMVKTGSGNITEIPNKPNKDKKKDFAKHFWIGFRHATWRKGEC